MSQGNFCTKDTRTVTKVYVTDNKVLINDIGQLRLYHGGHVRCPLCNKGTVCQRGPSWQCTVCHKKFYPEACSTCAGLLRPTTKRRTSYKCMDCNREYYKSMSKADPNVYCLRCGSNKITKQGKHNTLQRYQCIDCNYKFCPCAEQDVKEGKLI